MNIIQGSSPQHQIMPRVNPPSKDPHLKEGPEQNKSDNALPPGPMGPHGSPLTQDELRLLNQLKPTDMEVRQHEMAHVAAGAGLTSGMSLTYQKGPDGKNYAVAGEVQIDTAPVPGDPQATIDKMKQVKAAALAPATPSGQDQKVAANATAQAAKAAAELLLLRTQEEAEANEEIAFGPLLQERDRAYTQVNSLPEGPPNFQTRA